MKKISAFLVEWLYEIPAGFLMEHPLLTLLVQIVLIVGMTYLTTLLLVYLRMAGCIP